MGKRFTAITDLSTILPIRLKSNILKSLLFLMFALVFNTQLLKANNNTDELICNPNISVSLDNNCQGEISPDDVLEGTYPDYSLSLIHI